MKIKMNNLQEFIEKMNEFKIKNFYLWMHILRMENDCRCEKKNELVDTIGIRHQTSFHLISKKKYKEIKQSLNRELFTRSIVESDEQAWEVKQFKEDWLRAVHIFLSSKDFKIVYEEVQEIRRILCELNQMLYEWKIYYEWCFEYIPDTLIEDSKILEILNDPRVYTPEFERWLKRSKM